MLLAYEQVEFRHTCHLDVVSDHWAPAGRKTVCESTVLKDGTWKNFGTWARSPFGIAILKVGKSLPKSVESRQQDNFVCHCFRCLLMLV